MMRPAGSRRPKDRSARAVIGIPALWLIVFFAVPMLFILRMSLSDPASAAPPYRPVLDMAAGLDGLMRVLSALDLENYVTVLTDGLYASAFLTSLRIALLGTILTLIVGYPIAYAMSRAPRGWRPFLLAMIILPFWTSFLIRVYAWMAILRPEGLLTQALLSLGIIDQPLQILATETAIQIGIVSSYLPFMVLPIYAVLERQDQSLLEAAADLGATPLAAFWRITLPLSLPGIVGGSLLVFIPVMGEFIIPDLLGGSDTLMIGRLVWTEFFSNRDWPMASALAMLLLAIIAVPIALALKRDVTGGAAR